MVCQAVRDIVRESRVPLVPMATALSSRSDLHSLDQYDNDIVDRRGRHRLADCTHWCQPSEATVFMAMSALSMVAAVL